MRTVDERGAEPDDGVDLPGWAKDGHLDRFFAVRPDFEGRALALAVQFPFPTFAIETEFLLLPHIFGDQMGESRCFLCFPLLSQGLLAQLDLFGCLRPRRQAFSA